MIAQDKMVELIRMDVIDSINDVGVIETAAVYDVEYDKTDTRNNFIERCIASELERCYA